MCNKSRPDVNFTTLTDVLGGLINAEDFAFLRLTLLKVNVVSSSHMAIYVEWIIEKSLSFIVHYGLYSQEIIWNQL